MAQQILNLYKSFEYGVAQLPDEIFEKENERVQNMMQKKKGEFSLLSTLRLSENPRAIERADFTISFVSEDYMEGNKLNEKIAADMKRIAEDYFNILKEKAKDQEKANDQEKAKDHLSVIEVL